MTKGTPGNPLNRIYHHWEQQHHMASYEYHEFPKYVGGTPLKPIIVNDQDEYDTWLAGQPVVRETDEHARLVKVAEVKDVRIDKRWANTRIAKAIEDAGFDPDLNPFE